VSLSGTNSCGCKKTHGELLKNKNVWLQTVKVLYYRES